MPASAKTLDCLSVGILVADHLCSPIPQVPAAGQLVLADRLELTIGGCASNVAIDLARLGVGVDVVGCVGRDVFGQFVVETLRAAGAGVDSIRRLDGVDTSGTLIVNVAGQDRRFIHAVGANTKLSVADIPAERVAAARVLYVGGYALMPALDPEGLAQLFRQGRQAGTKTVLDVVLPGPKDYWPLLEPLLPETDVFLPNTDEAAVITGSSDPCQQALRLREAGAHTVVITCGGAGTVAISGNARMRAAAHRVPFVGGTGAGDAFDAGYIAGLLAGANAEQCVAWGAALGASCVRSISATASVFNRAEAEQFMREYPLKIEPW